MDQTHEYEDLLSVEPELFANPSILAGWKLYVQWRRAERTFSAAAPSRLGILVAASESRLPMVQNPTNFTTRDQQTKFFSDSLR